MAHSTFADDVQALAPDMVQLRQRLHRHPEVGLELPWTQAQLLGELAGLGLEISTGDALTSITAVLRGGAGGGQAPGAPAVLLRADMDALPVTEASGVDFASGVEGAMHACGHDLHMAMLVGAIKVLAAHRAELAGDVVFMVQPGEEGWDGAGLMLAEGVLDAAGPRVSRAYGMHVMSAKYAPSVFTSRPGTLMAASDWLDVTVRGRGAHGSAPHMGRDPISAIAEIIGSVHALVTRRFDVFDPVVVTVGSLHGGTKRNVIPDEAHFDATVRTFSAGSRERMREELPRLCELVGAAHGVQVKAVYREEYPVTVNDVDESAFVARTVEEVFGGQAYQPMVHPETGSEDFSRVLAQVPGCYAMLGACTGQDPVTAEGNHSPRATFSDEVIGVGMLLHVELAARSLAALAAGEAAAVGNA